MKKYKVRIMLNDGFSLVRNLECDVVFLRPRKFLLPNKIFDIKKRKLDDYNCFEDNSAIKVVRHRDMIDYTYEFEDDEAARLWWQVVMA